MYTAQIIRISRDFETQFECKCAFNWDFICKPIKFV